MPPPWDVKPQINQPIKLQEIKSTIKESEIVLSNMRREEVFTRLRIGHNENYTFMAIETRKSAALYWI